MGVYTTVADCHLYIDSVTLPDDSTLEKYIAKAELDIDFMQALPQPPVDSTTGRKIDVTKLNAYQLEGLSRATAAQVEYRLMMGPDFFVQIQPDTIKGPDFTTKGRKPTQGPECKRQLSRVGLLFSSTTTQQWGPR